MNNSTRMTFERFGDIDIFRPSSSSEIQIRASSEKHLRSKFPTGKYTDREEINRILHHQFAFYENNLRDLIESVACRNFLEFALSQYDAASEVENLRKTGKLSQKELNRWKEIGLQFRRATKYIAECTVFLQPDEEPRASEELLLPIAEKIWICAEEMISLYIVSDQTHSIFPDKTYLEIFPPGSPDYFFQGLDIEIPNVESRIYLDVSNRHLFVPNPPFPLDVALHEKIIGQAVKDSIGITYRQAIEIITQIIEGALPPPEGFPIPFVPKDKFVTELSKAFGISKDLVKTAIAGFSLSKKQMETEGRDAWNSKQEYRTYRRAFLKCLIRLDNILPFPRQWLRNV